MISVLALADIAPQQERRALLDEAHQLNNFWGLASTGF